MLNLRMALSTIYDNNNVHDRFLDKKAEKRNSMVATKRI